MPATMASEVPAPSPAGHPLRTSHFRNLWLAATVSLFGDQFYLVALPWLVLQLTSSSLALATILMAAAVPRAALMLVGGAVTDRRHPRSVLVATGVARAGVVGILAALTGLGVVELWHLYVLAFGFGVADAFAYPASAALLPCLVPPEQYAPANALLHGSAELSTLVGPAPAGWVVKQWGLATAFWIDALSFVGLVIALLGVPRLPVPRPPDPSAEGNMAASIRNGLRYVVHDPLLRTLLLVSTVLNVCLSGPVTLGLATAARFRFESAVAYGTLLSSFGAGALAGMLVAGGVKRLPREEHVLTAVMFALGAALAALGLVERLVPMALLLAGMGLCAGLVNVQVVSRMQLAVAPEMLGRVMSVLMLSAVGLLPFSLVAAGLVAQEHPTAMFLCAGGIVLLSAVAMLAMRRPPK
jgi:MFS family permease